MKNKHNLSGVYFRSKNIETGKFDNVVFEDLTLEEQNERMKDKNEEWLKSMVIQLADTLHDIGEQFNIYVD